jgi:hypothetical protein
MASPGSRRSGIRGVDVTVARLVIDRPLVQVGHPHASQDAQVALGLPGHPSDFCDVQDDHGHRQPTSILLLRSLIHLDHR